MFTITTKTSGANSSQSRVTGHTGITVDQGWQVESPEGLWDQAQCHHTTSLHLILSISKDTAETTHKQAGNKSRPELDEQPCWKSSHLEPCGRLMNFNLWHQTDKTFRAQRRVSLFKPSQPAFSPLMSFCSSAAPAIASASSSSFSWDLYCANYSYNRMSLRIQWICN